MRNLRYSRVIYKTPKRRGGEAKEKEEKKKTNERVEKIV